MENNFSQIESIINDWIVNFSEKGLRGLLPPPEGLSKLIEDVRQALSEYLLEIYPTQSKLTSSFDFSSEKKEDMKSYVLNKLNSNY